jgi:hypothetical protein
MVKLWMETGEITYHRRYVDDIIIIFDRNKITEDSVTSYVKNIHKYLEFKLTEEESKNINYLGLFIYRGNNNVRLGIYRKPTETDTTIHFTSNHPLEHKFLHKRNDIYTSHRTNKTARMRPYLYYS